MSLHQPASTVSMVLLYWPMAIRAVGRRKTKGEALSLATSVSVVAAAAAAAASLTNQQRDVAGQAM